ncbi:MAG TPA: hypothetical protein DCQ37_23295 [Desulfobacteraceae bacterium]|nr:hypothetical protein [Desulfobacteraceae bacterium]
MKKIMVLALAVALVGAFVMPAAALENQFGGYWRTRGYTVQNFTGEDKSEKLDWSVVDTRTRFYYTAVINENLKLVNKFEINSTWGDTNGGDIGADGEGNWRIKNSYADFTLAPVNFKIGMQYAILGHGFLFADDFAGAIITFKGEGFTVPFIWIKAFEGGKGVDANKISNNDFDFDYYALAPAFTVSEMLTIAPFAMWAMSENASGWKPTLHAPLTETSTHGASQSLTAFNEANIYYVGLDLDAKFDMGKAWFTAIYQGGSADYIDTKKGSLDFSAWLAAVGGAMNLSDMGDVHGQLFYATGSDPADEDFKSFFVPSQNQYTGQSYYWAEIMGFGVFDTYGSANSPQDKITNIMAGNLGTTYKPTKELALKLDVWYAKLAEGIKVYDSNGKVISDEDYLGTEVDLVITYELVKGLKIDLVGAYLFAGDATYKGDNQANPYEIGTQLSLSF